MEDNRMLIVAEEAIINLLLHLDHYDVINFFKAYPEFDYLLIDKYFLHELSVVNDIPNISNLDQLSHYSHLNIDERLEGAIKNEDLDGIYRMISLNPTNYNSVLLYASDNNIIDLVNLVINKDDIEDDEDQINKYRSAMYIAASRGYTDIVKIISKIITEKDTRNVLTYVNILRLSIENGLTETAKLIIDILKNDLNISIDDINHDPENYGLSLGGLYTLLINTFYHGHINTGRLLIEAVLTMSCILISL